jgi:hypothetical protein
VAEIASYEMRNIIMNKSGASFTGESWVVSFYGCEAENDPVWNMAGVTANAGNTFEFIKQLGTTAFPFEIRSYSAYDSLNTEMPVSFIVSHTGYDSLYFSESYTTDEVILELKWWEHTSTALYSVPLERIVESTGLQHSNDIVEVES